MKKIKFNLKTKPIILIAIILITISISVAYSAFSGKLNISGETYVRAQKDVRITNVAVESSANDGYTTYNDYNVNNITSGINLPNNNSTVTYNVEVTNLGNVEVVIKAITGLPNNLEIKSINNYTLEDTICNTNNECTLGISKNILITVGYKDNQYDESNTEYNIKLDFDFRRIFTITYDNIINNNYPSKILENESVTITFTNDIPSNVSVVNAGTYSFITPNLTINNPTGNIIVSSDLYHDEYNEIVCDGTNSIDTGIYLFNSENIDKNFEISFEISEYTLTATQATIMNTMDESGSPWPGMVFRINGTTKFELITTTLTTQNFNLNNLKKILTKRYNGYIYYKENTGNLTKIGKYGSTATFNVPVTFCSSINASGTPFRYFTGKLSNVSISVTDREYYNIHYDANGGTGTMPDQSVLSTEETNLNTNTFTNGNKIFFGWNTKADGSGTDYSDAQAVTDIANPNESITLYAIWASSTTYYVNYNANGGTGSMTNQTFKYGTGQNLSANTFTNTNSVFAKWNTKADGSGDSYLDTEEVFNLTKESEGTVTLYAIWAEATYLHMDDYTFNGTSDSINTNISLYSADNVHKDYEISFEIVNYEKTSVSQPTLMNSMYEVSPYPGILFRVDTNGKYQLNGTNNINSQYATGTVNKVKLKRVSDIIYLSINDENFHQIANHSAITTFNTPVTFGSSLQSDNTPWRFFKGTLKKMNVILY